MKRKNTIIIWPFYFNSELPRHRGRKVPKKLAIPSPQLEDIIRAASKLRLNFEVDPNSRYPRFWWKKSGRLLVKQTIPKYALLKRIGHVLVSEKAREK